MHDLRDRHRQPRHLCTLQSEAYRLCLWSKFTVIMAKLSQQSDVPVKESRSLVPLRPWASRWMHEVKSQKTRWPAGTHPLLGKALHPVKFRARVHHNSPVRRQDNTARVVSPSCSMSRRCMTMKHRCPKSSASQQAISLRSHTQSQTDGGKASSWTKRAVHRERILSLATLSYFSCRILEKKLRISHHGYIDFIGDYATQSGGPTHLLLEPDKVSLGW